MRIALTHSIAGRDGRIQMKTINKQCRNASGPSSYFQGRYARHCSENGYQWNVKLHGIDFDYSEVEAIQFYFLGEHIPLEASSSTSHRTEYGFEMINELLDRDVPAYLKGRSGGWLCINAELSDDEIAKVDQFISDSFKAIPDFLKEERAYKEVEKLDAERAEQMRRDGLANDPRLSHACNILRDLAGQDVVLYVQGIQIDIVTGKPAQK